jgi:hypothetical protein
MEAKLDLIKTDAVQSRFAYEWPDGLKAAPAAESLYDAQTAEHNLLSASTSMGGSKEKARSTGSGLGEAYTLC